MKAGNIRTAERHQELIANVITEPEWRRRGIAKLLLKEIMRGPEQSLDALLFHASDDDRNRYEQLGFAHTKDAVTSRQPG
jgi:predicted GNAT family acetyltransferase